MSIRNLEFLFKPKSVALIGASNPETGFDIQQRVDAGVDTCRPGRKSATQAQPVRECGEERRLEVLNIYGAPGRT